MAGSLKNQPADSLPSRDIAGNRPISFSGKVYLAVTVLLGAGILAVSLFDRHAGHGLRFGVFLACAVVVASLKVSLPGIAGSRSVNYVLILIGVIMLDLPQTLVVGIASSLVHCLWRPKKRPKPVDLLFNLPSSAIAVACCCF